MLNLAAVLTCLSLGFVWRRFQGDEMSRNIDSIARRCRTFVGALINMAAIERPLTAFLRVVARSAGSCDGHAGLRGDGGNSSRYP